MELFNLSKLQQNLLIASIIGDGEITKCYKGSRRKNNSYREHYSKEQEEYREWKQGLLPNLFYLTPKSQTLRSKSCKLFTELFPHFYNEHEGKKIPESLLGMCDHPMFLAILYMDDGTLSISKTANHKTKTIYYAPHITLYLQNYKLPQLQLFKKHIEAKFDISFSVNKRNDGYGHVLKLTKTGSTYQFLKIIEEVASSCPSMFYKTNWHHRMELEKRKLQKMKSDYKVVASSSERHPDYSDEEITQIIHLKEEGMTDKFIANQLDRTYWSIVYKIREIRKSGRL